ncbi:hypothetical protein BAUCODRAFT_223478 [Baudoinia panamericana UAMH 10762]|uniref:Uncharacterized protein n=1 Tax=Baudoinia panamericana (strain UAMH 10762) TaxID=717646 RepID=M2LIY5_BAUPA|nr:uncharacterized protein BAUCODRAFT_223478 [Baudoinia panamericana UAMH 10762]EMC94172.1 hypothetical protein BAUCODRAFT_223478 [Baudoinia panamericana UAMH 10762]
MPGSSRVVPQAAQVEDCESDESTARPDTARQARRRTQSTRPASKTIHRSDSGYSSHHAAVGKAAQVPAAVVQAATASRQAPPPTTLKSRPAVHRSESTRGRPQAPSRSASMAAQCTDPNCADPNCASKRNGDRRYVLPRLQDPTAYPPTATQYPPYQQPPTTVQVPLSHYQPPPHQYYAPPTPTTQAAPNLSQYPRARASSASRPSRPMSIHGAVNFSAYGVPQQHGPPPARSAWQNLPATYSSQYPPGQYYGTTPPNQNIPPYPQMSPLLPSPTSPTYAVAPNLTRTYSTRTVNTALPGYDVTGVAVAPMRPPTFSARQTSAMPGSFPQQETVAHDESEASQSYSESETDTEDERERELELRQRELERQRRLRDNKLMPPPSRRPSPKKGYTMPIVQQTTRPSARHAPRSDTGVEYSVSDQVDSDRTPRPTVQKPRTSSSYSSQSRRPSVSTTASSGRTKATTVSEGSGSRRYAIIEGRYGRKKEYLSSEQYDDLVRRYERQRHEEAEQRDRAEAYQQHYGGPRTPELTAENIQKAQRRQSGSHVSGSGHSRKSSQSSSKGSQPERIRIQVGKTVLHVDPDATVTMEPGDDGTHSLVVKNPSGRDSGYHGSKSSGSRASRVKDTITE